MPISLDCCCALGECLILPVLGLVSLFWVQTCCEQTRSFAQRQFLITLVIVTVMTLRTVIRCEPMWLIHTTTLSVMVIAAMFAPGHPPNTMASQASAD